LISPGLFYGYCIGLQPNYPYGRPAITDANYSQPFRPDTQYASQFCNFDSIYPSETATMVPLPSPVRIFTILMPPIVETSERSALQPYIVINEYSSKQACGALIIKHSIKFGY
jgi:hypothetical protein